MSPLCRENDRLILCSGPPAFTRMNRRRIYEILFVNTFGKGDLPSHEGKWIERRRQRYRKDDSNEGGMRRLPVYPVYPVFPVLPENLVDLLNLLNLLNPLHLLDIS